MIIEFIGCTGSGKSTISKEVIEKLQGLGANAISSYNFIMKRYRLGWIKNPIIVSVIIDILAFPWIVRSLGKYYKFFIFAGRIIFRDADSILYAVNIMRNIIKRVGIFEFIRAQNLDNYIFISDEGTVQQLHGVFVHVNSTPREDEIIRFVNFVPIPGIIVYVYSTLDVMIERTIYRGHRRIKELSKKSVEKFINNAHSAYEILISQEPIRKVLFSVENKGVGPEATKFAADKIVKYILDYINKKNA